MATETKLCALALHPGFPTPFQGYSDTCGLVLRHPGYGNTLRWAPVGDEAPWAHTGWC